MSAKITGLLGLTNTLDLEPMEGEVVKRRKKPAIFLRMKLDAVD